MNIDLKYEKQNIAKWVKRNAIMLAATHYGYDGNGNPSDFTDSQKETLREALRDIAKKLNETADNL